MFVRKQIFHLFATTLWVASILALVGQTCFGQFRDSFEGGRPRWQLGRNDTDAKLVQQQIALQSPHLGQGCERLEVTCKQGSTLHLLYGLPATRIVDELQASLWVRTPSSGLRLGFRIVFPWTAHPVTGNPRQAFVWGQPSISGGQWTELTIRSVQREFSGQLALLRSQFGLQEDLRDPYIDGLVIDAYRGPGVIRIELDDLLIEGMIDASDTRPGETELASRLPTSPEDIQLRLQERLYDLQRGIPHWLQYRGEGLEWLKTNGVTGVVLDAPQTLEWLASAGRAGIQVLTPPPAVTPPQSEWREYEAVHGWLLGSALDQSHIERSRELSQRLGQMPMALLRPTMAEAMEQHWGYARIADLLAIPAPLTTNVRDGQEMTDILRGSHDRARGRTIPLTSLSIQPSPEWLEQDRALQESIGVESREVPRFDILQARLSYYRSIAAGAKGWYFRSQSALDSGDEADLLRANALRAFAAESQWLSPWMQASSAPLTIPPSSIPGYNGTIHPLANSQLILLIASGRHDTLCAVPPSSERLTLELPNFNPRSQVLRISHGRLEPALSQKGPKRVEVLIERPGFIELVVVSSDDRVLNYLQERSNAAAQGLYDVQSQIANYLDKLANTILVAERLPPTHPSWRVIQEAKADIRGADSFAGRADFASAAAASERASILLQSVIRDSWDRGLTSFPFPQASPWIEQVFGLPTHWQLNRLLANRSWQAYPIPGWDDPTFRHADWNGMEQLGWSIDRRLDEQVDARLHLSLADKEGRKQFKLVANARNGQSISGGYAGSSLRLTSPPVILPTHSLFRIDGEVRALRCSQTAQAGLLVYDNIGGPSSGHLFRIEPSNQIESNAVPTPNDWQPLSLFRMLPLTEGARIMVELRGEGEFELRDLRISAIQPAAASQSRLSASPATNR